MLYLHHSQQDDVAKHLKTHTLYFQNTAFVILTDLINVVLHLPKIQNLLLQSVTEYFNEHSPNHRNSDKNHKFNHTLSNVTDALSYMHQYLQIQTFLKSFPLYIYFGPYGHHKVL